MLRGRSCCSAAGFKTRGAQPAAEKRVSTRDLVMVEEWSKQGRSKAGRRLQRQTARADRAGLQGFRAWCSSIRSESQVYRAAQAFSIARKRACVSRRCSLSMARRGSSPSLLVSSIPLTPSLHQFQQQTRSTHSRSGTVYHTIWTPRCFQRRFKPQRVHLPASPFLLLRLFLPTSDLLPSHGGSERLLPLSNHVRVHHDEGCKR